ncbi:MAG: hypothetical protein ACUZ77_06025 [Candidatus Brocadiales bacterium]
MLHDREYLLDILEAAKRAIAYVDEKTIEDFFNVPRLIFAPFKKVCLCYSIVRLAVFKI